ncbi:unnamed protein product [Dicrocoelium dendriticum]|nr:unnamed protein product [Dicrocoelium dendriticum]
MDINCTHCVRSGRSFTIASILSSDRNSCNKFPTSDLLDSTCDSRGSLSSSTEVKDPHLHVKAQFLPYWHTAESRAPFNTNYPNKQYRHPIDMGCSISSRIEIRPQLDDPRCVRNRSPRVPFSRFQVQMLEAKFQQTHYLSGLEVQHLAWRLELSQTRVKIWFQNRRARQRRDQVAFSTSYPTATSDSTAVAQSTWSDHYERVLCNLATFSAVTSDRDLHNTIDNHHSDYSIAPSCNKEPFQLRIGDKPVENQAHTIKPSGKASGDHAPWLMPSISHVHQYCPPDFLKQVFPYAKRASRTLHSPIFYR